MHSLTLWPKEKNTMARKILNFTSLFALTSLMLVCSLMTSTAAAPDAQTTTDNFTVPISDTSLDCAGNLVTLEGEIHTVVHTTFTDNGRSTTVFHVNQRLHGISADGTRHVMNRQTQETVTADTTDSFPAERTFILHFNINNNDPNVPQLHVKATFHITVNANGEVTGTQLILEDDCQG
jgi:hypothetical protein